jgi:hypothetical protein
VFFLALERSDEYSKTNGQHSLPFGAVKRRGMVAEELIMVQGLKISQSMNVFGDLRGSRKVWQVGYHASGN